MPPLLGLCGGLILVAWLFYSDSREPPVGSRSLWLTGTWFFLVCSRSAGAWVFTLLVGRDPRASQLQGNPIDIVVLTFFFTLAVYILNGRRFSWNQFFSSNIPVILIYGFFLFSSVWADYPLVTIKRVIKDSGLLFLALVIATEPNWKYALRKLALRVSFLVLPLSIVFIKWFPSIGRISSAGGETMNGGVAVHKNTLGQVLMVLVLLLLWDFVELLKQDHPRLFDSRVLRRLLLFTMAAWLLYTAHSQTAIVCLSLGLVLFALAGWLAKSRAPKRNLILITLTFFSLFAVDSIFDVREELVRSLGRDMTLTGRTRIWEIVKAQPTDPILGCGFMMFWDTPYGDAANDEIGARLNSAHNGYLETYLDGGLVGIGLLILMLVSKGKSIIDNLVLRSRFGRLGFVYFFIAILYNFSESSFFRLGSLWLMLLMAMVMASTQSHRVQPTRFSSA